MCLGYKLATMELIQVKGLGWKLLRRCCGRGCGQLRLGSAYLEGGSILQAEPEVRIEAPETLPSLSE